MSGGLTQRKPSITPPTEAVEPTLDPLDEQVSDPLSDPLEAPQLAEQLQPQVAQKQKKGLFGRMWGGMKKAGRKVKSGGKAALEGFGSGALNGALVGGTVAGAAGATAGGALGAVGGKNGAKLGAKVFGGLAGVLGAIGGAVVGGFAGMVDRGVDELTTDEEAILDATKEIPGFHIMLEQFAHTYAYGKGDRGTLAQWGYTIGGEHVDDRSGFRMLLLVPQPGAMDPDGKPLRPVAAFRGTANKGGAEDDTNKAGVGTFQFSSNEAQIGALLKSAGGPCVVTGHSLGGALAQLAAARFGSSTSDIVTFQSPGINAAEITRIDKDKHKATHYRTEGDLVSVAGEAYALGDVFTFEEKGPNSPKSHTRMALAQINALRKKYDVQEPILEGARGSDDTWQQEGEGFHSGQFEGDESVSTSNLKGVRKDSDGRSSTSTSLTRLIGAERTRKIAPLVQGSVGLGGRQTAYATAWREVRGRAKTVMKAKDMDAVRAYAVDAMLRNKVDPQDHGRFISQLDAAMFEALEGSPLFVGKPMS